MGILQRAVALDAELVLVVLRASWSCCWHPPKSSRTSPDGTSGVSRRCAEQGPQPHLLQLPPRARITSSSARQWHWHARQRAGLLWASEVLAVLRRSAALVRARIVSKQERLE